MRAFLVLCLTAAMACVSVDATEHCVETRYGKIVKERMDNGLNTLGWNDATCFSLTDQNFPQGDEGKENIEAQTSDPVTIQGDVAVVFAYDPATIPTLFQEKRSAAAAEVVVLNAIREGYRTALAGWSVAEIFSENRAYLSDSVKAHIQRKLGVLAQIRTVYVRNIILPKVIEDARIQAAKQQQVLDQAQKQYVIDSVNARATILSATATSEAKRLEAASYATNPKLLDLEIAKAMAAICGKATTCVLGGSIADTWNGGIK